MFVLDIMVILDININIENIDQHLNAWWINYKDSWYYAKWII